MRMILALTMDLNWHLSDMDGSMFYTPDFRILNEELLIRLNISFTDDSSHNGMVVFG
jgi:hypothetical protein